MLCPDCGVETEGLVEGSCGRCFTRRHDVAQLPPHLDVLLCASCGARRDGEHWTDPAGRAQDALLDEVVVAATQVHKAIESPHLALEATPQDDKNIRYDVMVDGMAGGIPVEDLYETVVRIKQGACTSCSRQAGGYFSAIIQLRGAVAPPTDAERQEAGGLIIRAIDRMHADGNQGAFLTKQGKVKGGHDFYVSEIDVARIAAKKVADRFDTVIEESPKLVGRKEGRDVYRVTMLVRLPPYRTGDFVDVGRGPCRIQRVNQKTLNLRDLATGRATSVPRDQVKPHHVVAKRDDERDMMVVSVVQEEALLLDPDTNRTHEVLLPPDLKYDLSIRTLATIEHDGQVYTVGLSRTAALPVV